jgi:hypothetical protein
VRNQYVGDIVDSVKYSLLRVLIHGGCKLGVNWYLAPDEEQAEPGQPQPPEAAGIPRDEELFQKIKVITSSRERRVSDVENLGLLPGAVFFGDLLDNAGDDHSVKSEHRVVLHAAALNKLSGCDLIYLDPNIGVLKDIDFSKINNGESFATYDEVKSYYSRGQNVILFQSGIGFLDSDAIALFSDLAGYVGADSDAVRALVYRYHHPHYYLILSQRGDVKKYDKILSDILMGDYFEEVHLWRRVPPG